MSAWPFDQPQNCAIVTQRQCVENTLPILLVVHDAEDHGWQFLSGLAFDMADAQLVALGGIVRVDPSLLTIADLPPGWQAARESAESDWIRIPSPPETDI